jgi:uncharacterized membrane protein YhaH (DUF805 family)
MEFIMQKNNIFYTAIKSCFLKYATFKGRATRSEYWLWVLFTTVAGLLLFILDPRLYFIFYILVLLPSIAVSVRRLHDVNRSGWWLLIGLTGIGAIILLYWHCCKSYEKKSEYGKLNKT